MIVAADNHVVREKLKGLKWAIVLSVLLSAGKAAAGIFCSSAALIASALDSLMDVGVSSVNYVSLSRASRPPDSDHAYGHEKFESLASYTQGVIFVLFACVVLWESLRRGLAGAEVAHSGVAIAAIFASAAGSGTITWIVRRTQKKTGSLILKSESLHYSMDLVSYVLIFAVLLLVRRTGWAGWDILGGVCLSAYIACLAAGILLQAGNELVDRSLPKKSLDQLDSMIRSHDPSVLGYHELRTRKVADKHFIDFHLVLKSNQSFEDAHMISETLIEKIRTRIPNADVTIHQDPEHAP